MDILLLAKLPAKNVSVAALTSVLQKLEAAAVADKQLGTAPPMGGTEPVWGHSAGGQTVECRHSVRCRPTHKRPAAPG